MEYFLKELSKFTVPTILVRTNSLGSEIDLSTCDSAAKCIIPLNLYFLNIISSLLPSLYSLLRNNNFYNL